MDDSGVRDVADVNATACVDGNEISILIWHYHDDDVIAGLADVNLRIQGLRRGSVLCEHFRVDMHTSNAYTAWKKMGHPQNPDAEQFKTLERAGQLALCGSPVWHCVENPDLTLPVKLSLFGVSLVRLRW